MLVTGLALLILSRRHRLFAVACVCIGAAFGIFRFVATDTARDLPQELVGSEVSFRGVVINEPVHKEKDVRIEVVVDGTPIHVLVTVPNYPEYQYGDQIEFSGKLEAPKNFDDQFDWVGYLTRHGISYTARYAQVYVVGHDGGLPFMRVLFSVKRTFMTALRRYLGEPEASFGGGVALGAQDGLPPDLTEKFRITGTSHVIAVSGYNVTIVAVVAEWIFSFLPQAFSFSFGVIGILLFTLVTGAQAATVRAAIMTLFVMFAKRAGRPGGTTRALVIAVIAMVAYAPRILVFDASFQLSFAAMVGIVYLAPIIETLLEVRIPWASFRGLVSATLGAEIAVLPLIIHMNGQISVVALFVNMIVIPLVPLAMGLVFLTGLLGIFLPVIVSLPAFFTRVVLAGILGVIKTAAALPFAYVTVPTFGYWGVFVSYVCIAICFEWLRRADEPLLIRSGEVAYELID